MFEESQKIAKENQKKMLSELGVEEGNIARASVEQLENYRNKLYKIEETKKDHIALEVEETILKARMPETRWGKYKLTAMKAAGHRSTARGLPLERQTCLGPAPPGRTTRWPVRHPCQWHSVTPMAHPQA